MLWLIAVDGQVFVRAVIVAPRLRLHLRKRSAIFCPHFLAPHKKRFSIGTLAKMNGQYSQKYPEIMMAALIACVPMIIIYIFFACKNEECANDGQKNIDIRLRTRYNINNLI